MNWPDILLTANLVSTLFLSGLIWWVQVVHYPLLLFVSPDDLPRYQGEHVRRAGLLVPLPMLIELGSGLALTVDRSPAVPGWQVWLGVALIGALWLVTFLVQVPQHKGLAEFPDRSTKLALIRWNWVRTALWSARSVLVVWVAQASLDYSRVADCQLPPGTF